MDKMEILVTLKHAADKAIELTQAGRVIYLSASHSLQEDMNYQVVYFPRSEGSMMDVPDTMVTSQEAVDNLLKLVPDAKWRLAFPPICAKPIKYKFADETLDNHWAALGQDWALRRYAGRLTSTNNILGGFYYFKNGEL